MSQLRKEFIVAPIAVSGLGYSLAIGYAVHHHLWTVAVIMFCYGLALLGARIAQLIVLGSRP